MQQFLTMRGKFYEHFPAVFLTVPTRDRSAIHEAIDQFNGTVMAQTEPFRKRPDGRTAPLRQSFYGQEDLVLMWFDALRSGRFLAQVLEVANAIAELRKLPVSLGRDLIAAWSRTKDVADGHHERHLILVSYHDVIGGFNGTVPRRGTTRRQGQRQGLHICMASPSKPM
jgi:hypothetical protein